MRLRSCSWASPEEIRRSVDRIDHPAVGLKVSAFTAFFTEYSIMRKGEPDRVFDQLFDLDIDIGDVIVRLFHRTEIAPFLSAPKA